jgi:hypothetical protein
MTDLTQRQLHDAILRSLKETGKRMAEDDQPAPGARVRSRARPAGKARKGADSKSSRRS